MLKKINYKIVRDKIPNNTCIKIELRPITYKNSKNHVCWFGHHKDKDGPFREKKIYIYIFFIRINIKTNYKKFRPSIMKIGKITYKRTLFIHFR